ncbi:hypothetical protein BT96DRAFT_1001481 [Gymnopus androsaceus JB14]|uniref:Uncharacterized protein n=1 Tax=Gymnopus androsaceus JB14 TaxID=1447944 RepID=A0A6A4H0H5_9AGAR|nr:hypothetical protein BT96DRAFT_1001481 [Gymnopus androsaceus JB14]
MIQPPNTYTVRKIFLDGLPAHIILHIIECGAAPNLATLSKMMKEVEHLEDNKALENFYLKCCRGLGVSQLKAGFQASQAEAD